LCHHLAFWLEQPEVVCMESIGKIRRRHKVKGESISAIAHDLNLSRNTVKKYLNAKIDPIYQRDSQPAPKLGAIQPVLEALLPTEKQVRIICSLAGAG
jgi:hypothetical protein